MYFISWYTFDKLFTSKLNCCHKVFVLFVVPQDSFSHKFADIILEDDYDEESIV